MAKRISVAVYDQNGVKAEKKVNLNLYHSFFCMFK